MEYFLRKIEPGNPTPFIIELTSISYVFGRDRKCAEFQKLKKFPQISQHHACFVRKEDDWYIADMGSRDGTFINCRKLEPYSLKMIKVGDYIGFGTADINAGFVCVLCVKCPPEVEIKTEIEEVCSRTEETDVRGKSSCESEVQIEQVESSKNRTEKIEIDLTNDISENEKVVVENIGLGVSGDRKRSCDSEVQVNEVLSKKIKTENESTVAISGNKIVVDDSKTKKVKTNVNEDGKRSCESDVVSKKIKAELTVAIPRKETANNEITIVKDCNENISLTQTLDVQHLTKVSSHKNNELKSIFIPSGSGKQKLDESPKINGVKKQIKKDKKSFEDILRIFKLNKSLEGSSPKLNSYRSNIDFFQNIKSPEMLVSNSNFNQNSSFTDNGGKVCSETHQVRQRIKKIHESLQSKGKIRNNHNSTI